MKRIKEEILICEACKVAMTMSGDDAELWQHLTRAFERYHTHKNLKNE